MHGCANCGRIYAPHLAPSSCGECRSTLELLPLIDAFALARRRRDRLRREHVMRLAGRDRPELLGRGFSAPM